MSLTINIQKLSEEILNNAAAANQARAKTIAVDDYERIEKEFSTMAFSLSPIYQIRMAFLEAGIVDEFPDMQALRTQLATMITILQDGVVPDSQIGELKRAVHQLKLTNAALLDEIWENFVEAELPTVEFLRNKALVTAMREGDGSNDLKRRAAKVGELNQKIDDQRAETPSQIKVKESAKWVRDASSQLKGLVEKLTGDNPQVAEFLRGVAGGVPLNEVGEEVWIWLRENHLDSFYVVARPQPRTRK